MEGTSGQESPGIMGRAPGGAAQGGQREQLDLASGNSWRGEPGSGHGQGWVRAVGTRGCPSRNWTKLRPCGARGARSRPSHPQSSCRCFSSFRMDLMKLPGISRSRETAAGWQERGH